MNMNEASEKITAELGELENVYIGGEREFRIIDGKKNNLRRQLSQLNEKAVENGFLKLESVLQGISGKRVRRILEKVTNPYSGKIIVKFLTNDDGYAQVVKKVMGGRNTVRNMREKNSIPEIESFVENLVKEILEISMEAGEVSIDSEFFYPLDDRPVIKATLKEIFDSDRQAKFDRLMSEAESLRK